MRSMRFSLQQYCLETSKFDIILNGEFVDVKTVFENGMKLVKASRKSETNHHAEAVP